MLVPALAFVGQFRMTFKDYATAAKGNQLQHAAVYRVGLPLTGASNLEEKMDRRDGE